MGDRTWCHYTLFGTISDPNLMIKIINHNCYSANEKCIFFEQLLSNDGTIEIQEVDNGTDHDFEQILIENNIPFTWCHGSGMSYHSGSGSWHPHHGRIYMDSSDGGISYNLQQLSQMLKRGLSLKQVVQNLSKKDVLARAATFPDFHIPDETKTEIMTKILP